MITCSDAHTIKIWNYNQNEQKYDLSKTININQENEENQEKQEEIVIEEEH